MTNEEYCENVLDGKVIDRDGFFVCEFWFGIVKKAVPLEKVKQERLLDE